MLMRSLTSCLLVLALSSRCCFAAEKRVFAHPSVMSTQRGLDELKRRVSSSAPCGLGYEELKQSPYADLTRPHTPYATVYVAASGGTAYELAFRGDAQAAHAAALMWVITEDPGYRDKAMRILDDWAATYAKIEVSKGGANQAQLEAAWAVPIWIAAADIIRYHDGGKSGWKPDRVAAFDRFLNRMVQTARGARRNNNNWGTSATLAILAAAVYQEDEAAYAEALALYAQHLRDISKPSGALGPDYLRDPWHPQYTLLTWIQACEIAWNQGDDLYSLKLDGQLQPRLAVCLEHFAKLFTGRLPNPEGLKKGDYRGSHKQRQGYDMAFNHFIGRGGMGEAMPTFAALVPAWRPGGIDPHFAAWDTLTHGGLSAAEAGPAKPQAQRPGAMNAGDGL